MSRNKLMGGLFSWLSSVLLIIVILLTTIEQNAFDLKFFFLEYQKLNIAESTGISEQELNVVTKELLAYLRAERNNIQLEANIGGVIRPVFNQKEIAHLADVQQLYLLGMRSRNLGIVFFLVFLVFLRLAVRKKMLRYWAGGYLAGSGLALGMLGALYYFISSDFLMFWNNFHSIIFSNNLWQLDPGTDLLIRIVPEQFFSDLVFKILTNFFLALLALAILAICIMMRTKALSEKN